MWCLPFTIQELTAAVISLTKIIEVAESLFHGDLDLHMFLPPAVPHLARNNNILLPTPFAT